MSRGVVMAALAAAWMLAAASPAMAEQAKGTATDDACMERVKGAAPMTACKR